jgi:small subunit ribosomal protein S6
MSKVKSSKIPEYELLCLIPNKYAENEVAAINQKIKKIIEDNGGEIKNFQDWGKKRLAYPIKGYIFGYYQLIRITVSGDKINIIDRLLRLAPEILRHQIVKYEEYKTVSPDRKPAVEAETAKPQKPKESARSEEKAKEKEAAKADLKDLDDKLDKILEGGDLLK